MDHIQQNTNEIKHTDIDRDCPGERGQRSRGDLALGCGPWRRLEPLEDLPARGRGLGEALHGVSIDHGDFYSRRERGRRRTRGRLEVEPGTEVHSRARADQFDRTFLRGCNGRGGRRGGRGGSGAGEWRG